MQQDLVSALSDQGLGNLQSVLGNLTEEAFCNLTLGDLGRLGIKSISDRKAVHKAVMQVKSRARAPPRPTEALDLQQELIDLDDGVNLDLLSHAVGPSFQLSPMAGDRASKGPSPVPGLPGNGYPQGPIPSSNNTAPAGFESTEDPPKIRVVVRKRPMNKKEREKGEDDIVECHMDRSCIVVNETKLKVDLTKYVEKHQFNFDEALDEQVSNDAVYNTTVQPLVHTLFRNGKASCFAYGQTGSGKTYTMSPLPIRAAADIMKYLAMDVYLDVNLQVSCFEIYGNKVFDLLNQRKRLNILEDGKKQVVVVGLREVTVQHTDAVKQLIDEANRNRSVGSTAANADSSRSHSIMQFALKKGMNADGEGKLIGKISFIDLAGSERGADTYDNNRQTRLEGAEINKSLLALKECIRALDSDARHVPFRGSKLTAVLRDSFLGDQARTVMIANISPNSLSVEHTLNTLRYADRVKELRKDKAERAPGGVTPGENPDYYAAVARANAQPSGAQQQQQQQQQPQQQQQQMRDKSPLRDLPVRSSRPRTPSRISEQQAQRAVDAIPQRQGSINHRATDDDGLSGGYPGKHFADNGNGFGFNANLDDDMDDQLLRQRDDLMDTILEEEEQLITAHRLQIEETMDAVRKEMQLLTEVDQPGSAIDQYVEKLDTMLQYKLELILGLKHKLDRFKDHLNQEEMMSRSIPPSAMKKY